jgi:lipoprotein-releasing system permease protein
MLIYNSTLSNGIEGYERWLAEVKKISGIKDATGVVFGWGLGSSIYAPYTACFLYGIDPQEYGNATNLLKNADIELDIKKSTDWILLGKGLARKLQVKSGDRVKIITAGGSLTPLGVVPLPRTFRFSGTFETGIWQSNETWALIPRDRAQKMFNMKNRVNVIQASVYDIENAAKVAKIINEKYGDALLAVDWSSMNREFYSALKLEKLLLFLTLGLIVGVAALNIVSTMVVIVVQKKKSIGILRSMGADRCGIMFTFILQGIVVGLLGIILGLIFGISLSVVLDSLRIIRLDPQIYPIEYIRFKVEFIDCLWVVILAFLISLIATIYPSYRASRLKPAESLRYE